MANPIRVRRGLQVGFDSLVSEDALVPHMLYYTTDQRRLFVSDTSDEYTEIAKKEDSTIVKLLNINVAYVSFIEISWPSEYKMLSIYIDGIFGNSGSPCIFLKESGQSVYRSSGYSGKMLVYSNAIEPYFLNIEDYFSFGLSTHTGVEGANVTFMRTTNSCSILSIGGIASTSGRGISIVSGSMTTTTAISHIKIAAETGTISGNATVYGYK